MSTAKVNFNAGVPFRHSTEVVAKADGRIHCGNGAYSLHAVNYVEFSDGKPTLSDLLESTTRVMIEFGDVTCTLRGGNGELIKCKKHELYEALIEARSWQK